LLALQRERDPPYWLGALNRRHQEAREDATRWYEPPPGGQEMQPGAALRSMPASSIDR
jgi:hypothetical protein